MNKKDILDDIEDKYGEWLEHAGDQRPALIINILLDMIVKDRSDEIEKIDFKTKVDRGCNALSGN